MDRPKAIEHSDNCDWHLDQYDFECTCGKSAAYLYSVNQKLRADKAKLRVVLGCVLNVMDELFSKYGCELDDYDTRLVQNSRNFLETQAR